MNIDHETVRTFADRGLFAIEYTVDFQRASLTHGRLQLYAGGVGLRPEFGQVVFEDFVNSLRSSAFGWGNRRCERFERMATKVVADALDRVLYLGGDPELDKLALDEEWSRLEVIDPFFAGCKLFIVGDGIIDRLIRLRSSSVLELRLPAGVVDETLRASLEDVLSVVAR